MNSKVSPFLLGLLLGAVVCGLVLGRRGSPVPAPAAQEEPTHESSAAELKADLATTRSRLEQADAENNRLTARVEELERERRETPPATSADSPEQNFLAAMFGGSGTNGISSAMSDMIKASMEQELENRMLSLQGKLDLSVEQEAAIRKLLTAGMDKGMQMAQQMMKGELRPDELPDHDNEADQDEQIKALLTPEQAAAYDAFQQEENVRLARLQANSELLELQSALNLTEEQQDKVFAVLYQQVKEGNSSEELDLGDGPDNYRLGLERKLEALRPVLTPEQLARYQKQQEQQAKLIEAFMPKFSTNANVSAPGGASILVPSLVIPR